MEQVKMQRWMECLILCVGLGAPTQMLSPLWGLIILSFMDLSVQNQLLHRQFLSKMAYNAIHSLLAVIADGADTVSFFHFQPQPSIFTQIFQCSSRPSGKKSSIAWAPSGVLLSLGSAHLQIWKLDDHKLLPLRNYNDDFIDIKIIAWSPDSTSLAYAGLSKKNAIKVRSLENGNCGELAFDVTISAISYDPFGKYLLVLAHSNILYVYNCTSLTKLREVPLSPNTHPQKHTSTVKEIRVMSWSPDFNYLVCPSLDDSKVSLAFSLCRGLNFKTTHAFIGHASSISCASFSPVLYEWQGEFCSILALGDSHGVVSIWRVSSKTSPTPLLLSNTKTDYNEVVEQLEWSSSGDVLFANLMKRYVSIIAFKKSCFGRQISAQEKSSIIESNFGVMSASQIHKKQLQIFSFGSVNAVDKSVAVQQVVVAKPLDYNFSERQQKLGEKVQYVKINEQVTIKDKNNRKKIQPAVLVRREEADKRKDAHDHHQNTTAATSSVAPAITTTSVIPTQFKPLTLKPLSSDIELGRLFTNRFLQIKKLQNYSILQLVEYKDGEFVVVNERTFVGVVEYIRNVEKLIYVYNKGNLSIFDYELNLQELPIFLGQLHKLTINAQGDIYFLSVQGFIRGFNHLKRVCYTPASVPIHTLLHVPDSSSEGEAKKQSEGVVPRQIESFSVQNDHNLYVTVSSSAQRYLFDRQSGCWISLELNQGLLKMGHSIKVSDLQQKLIDDFFRKIGGKGQAQTPKGQTAIQQYESNLIFYKKHHPNRELYKQNLLGLIRQLKMKGMAQKLRLAMNKYFVHEGSEFYESDQGLRRRVKGIGGNVIEQFMHFGGI